MYLRLLDYHFFLSEAGEWVLKVSFREMRLYLGKKKRTNLAEVDNK